MPAFCTSATGCDPIIKQHKIRCLRVTVMHSYRSVVWVGTSAGLVLGVPALHVSKDEAASSDIAQLPCYGCYHGHTGPVRFITTVERPLNSKNNAPASNTAIGRALESSAETQSLTSAQTSAPTPAGPGPALMSLVKSTAFLVDPSSLQRPAIKPSPSGNMLTAEHYRPLAELEALVVTGGDGYEDFHVTSVLENDENNYENGGSHILMWQID